MVKLVLFIVWISMIYGTITLIRKTDERNRADENVIAKIDEISGIVLIRGAGAITWEEAGKNNGIIEGDQISTGRRAKVQISFTDGRVISLGENSYVILNRQVTGSDQLGSIVTVLKGDIQVTEQKSILSKPNSTARARPQAATLTIQSGENTFVINQPKQSLAIQQDVEQSKTIVTAATPTVKVVKTEPEIKKAMQAAIMGQTIPEVKTDQPSKPRLIEAKGIPIGKALDVKFQSADNPVSITPPKYEPVTSGISMDPFVYAEPTPRDVPKIIENQAPKAENAPPTIAKIIAPLTGSVFYSRKINEWPKDFPIELQHPKIQEGKDISLMRRSLEATLTYEMDDNLASRPTKLSFPIPVRRVKETTTMSLPLEKATAINPLAIKASINTFATSGSQKAGSGQTNLELHVFSKKSALPWHIMWSEFALTSGSEQLYPPALKNWLLFNPKLKQEEDTNSLTILRTIDPSLIKNFTEGATALYIETSSSPPLERDGQWCLVSGPQVIATASGSQLLSVEKFMRNAKKFGARIVYRGKVNDFVAEMVKLSTNERAKMILIAVRKEPSREFYYGWDGHNVQKITSRLIRQNRSALELVAKSTIALFRQPVTIVPDPKLVEELRSDLEAH